MLFSNIKRFQVCICLIFFSCCIDAYTQNTPTKLYSVSGNIIDNTTQLPAEFVTIILKNANDNSLAGHSETDSTGFFRITCTQGGDYYLTISSLEYKPIEKTASFSLSSNNNAVQLGRILLEQSQEELGEVVMVGQRRQIVYKLDKQVIEASGYLSAAGGTAADILTQTPYIQMDVEGNITFRGISGFKVYIDGKPSAIDGSAALEQIPAGQIENIEVLSTPSARNDADGAAGIININTKKQKLEGWSGIVNVMGSSELSRNIDFMYSLRKKDYRWQLSGEVSRRYVLSDFEQSKSIYNTDSVINSQSIGDRERHVDVYTLRAGFDWFKENTTWSAAIQPGYRDRWRGGDLSYNNTSRHLTYGGVAPTNTLFNGNGSDFVHLYEWNLRPEFGVEHRFPNREGHVLTASMYALYQGDAMENFQTDLWSLDGKQTQGHRAWEDEYRFTAQLNVDYVYPFLNSTGKFESGYQFFTYTEDGDYTVDMFDDNIDKFVRRDDLYNKFLFRRDIHAMYAMLSDRYSAFSYQLGLRSEYSYRKLGNNLKWAHHSKHKFDLFPSAHLALDMKENSQLRLSYARRITQPELFYMEPYVVYVDYYTAQRGNPFIKPEYTNSIELGYNKTFNNSTLAATLFHRNRTDKIERIRVPFQNEITLDSMTNVGNDYATGLELVETSRINRWWNLDINGSLYYYQVKNEYKVNGTDENSWNWQLAVNNNWDIAKNTRMRMEAYYVGPMVSTQGRVNEFFYLNLTVRQQLMNRKLAASLVVRDVLATAKYTRTQSVPGMDSRTVIYPSAPLFTLTLSYTFNNFKPQQKTEKVDHDIFEGTNR